MLDALALHWGLHGLSVAFGLFPVMEWIVSEQFLALSDSPLWAGQPFQRIVLGACAATREIRNTSREIRNT